MANPRKFSDKLEIIRRKEEEANAAFVQIMREVTDARKGSQGPSRIGPHQPNAWIHNSSDYMKMRQKYKGGSLPNVSLSPNPSVNLQQNLYGVNDAYGQQPPPPPTYGGIPSGGGHVRRSMEPPSGPIFPSRNKYRSFTSPYRSNLLQQPSLIEEQNEAPSLWRRTYSDSAIQQTLQLPPKTNTNGSSTNLLQTSAGPRIVQNPNQPQLGNTDAQTYPRSTPASLHFSGTTPCKNNLHIQADTSSLPDLSNLSIPSPIQTPIDGEQDNKNVKQREQPNHFQMPYRIPPRRNNFNKQMYQRQINSSGSDIIDSLHRDQKPNLNLFNDINASSTTVSGVNSNSIISHSAPLSPVTNPSYFWNNTPISPLATADMRPGAPATDLQQQLFQLQNENLRNNGINHPPPYFSNDDDSFSSHCTNNYLNHKQNLCRMNSGPSPLDNSKSIWDQPLEAALMQVKAEQSELSQADLNCVGVALDPLDFNDVQMLADNAQIVDQSAEEQFRLERASYI